MRRPGGIAAGAVLLLVAGWAVRPGWFTGQSATRGTAARRFAPPSPQHPFGTDQLGRDVYARVVHGTAPSVQAALLAIALGLTAGVLLGLLAAGPRRSSCGPSRCRCRSRPCCCR